MIGPLMLRLAHTSSYQVLPLSLLVSQLAFDNSAEADKFLQQFGANIYRPSAASSTAGSSAATPLGGTPGLGDEEDKRQVDCKAAHPRFVEALAKFNKVDLKGQI